MSLREELAARLAEFNEKAPADTRATIEGSIAALVADGIVERAARAGDRAPDFTLPDQLGRPVSLAALLARGPVVVAFYRGGWCPYCNLELRAWQRVLPELDAIGATLLAISPQTPDESLSTAAKNELRFHVLSDAGASVAARFGIVYELGQALRALYSKLGYSLPEINGTDDWRLPVPATFVIGADGRILLAHVDPDYRTRLEPADAVRALREATADAS